MIKRKYIKRMYVEEAYCDKCGAPLRATGMVLTSWPEQFPYECSNENCDFTTTFVGNERPGSLKFEFYEDDEIMEEDGGWDTK